jgi:trk system potassium uptake protein
MHRVQSGSLRLALGFAALIAAGTVLLRLPIAAKDTSLGWLDALFTATSGVCVTGLSTIQVGEGLADGQCARQAD